MGLFDSIFGSSSDSESTLKLNEKKTGTKKVASVEDKTSEITKESTGQTTQDTTQQQQTTTLDEGTQNILRDLIGGLSGDFQAGGGTLLDPKVLEASSGNIDFASFLQGRAGETEDVLNASTGDIVGEARRQGENALELQGTRLAAGAGSNLNSIVQASNAQGRSDLETQLAGLTANLGIQARQAGSTDLNAAFGASNEAARAGADIQIAGQTGGVQSISQLIDNLTGAETETVGGTQAVGTSLESSQISELVKAIQAIAVESEETRETAQTTSQSGSSSDSLFDNFISLIGAFPTK